MLYIWNLGLGFKVFLFVPQSIQLLKHLVWTFFSFIHCTPLLRTVLYKFSHKYGFIWVQLRYQSSLFFQETHVSTESTFYLLHDRYWPLITTATVILDKMLRSNYSLPLSDLLWANLRMMSLALGTFDLSFLLFTHWIPFFTYITYDISHSPGRIIFLEVSLSTLNIEYKWWNSTLTDRLLWYGVRWRSIYELRSKTLNLGNRNSILLINYLILLLKCLLLLMLYLLNASAASENRVTILLRNIA